MTKRNAVEHAADRMSDAIFWMKGYRVSKDGMTLEESAVTMLRAMGWTCIPPFNPNDVAA